MPIPKAKRKYGNRPTNWRDITLHFMTFKNLSKTMKTFGLLIQNVDETAKEKNFNYWRTTLGRWKKQIHSDRKFEKCGKLPVYGKAIDDELADVVRNYNQNGVPMNDFILRCCLLDILTRKLPNMITKIVNIYETAENGQYKFGRSWAKRFWKRHTFSNRTATTKMRDDLPADYQMKKDLYENLLSIAINKFDVCDDLIVGLDETNTQFVPQVKKTRVAAGTKRVRVVGIGHEKPQITVTIALSANGEVLNPTQCIFGGKTNRSLPNQGKTPPPPDQYFEKTASHWQTPLSFITYVTKVLVPYRNNIITEKILPEDQKMIVLLDLHYSHKDPAVLALFKANHMIPIFIPAGCTDIHQVGDAVANKPYKNGVANAFIDYASKQYEEWNRTKADDDDCFRLNLSIGVMKPVISSFVTRGLDALKTNDMKAAIKKSFYENGLVGSAKLQSTYTRALATAVAYEDGEPVVVPNEIEEEENVGVVTEETEAVAEAAVDANENLGIDTFVIAVGELADGGLDSDLSDSESSEPDSDSNTNEPEEAPQAVTAPTKRVRVSNTMLGSVKGGKYSTRK
jgi:hypothetical protein